MTAPIRDYGVIGDGRTVALIASDGSIDWLCLPNLDSPSVFGALLDDRRGGSFLLAPAIGFEAERRYLPDTNLLETTYTTDRGRVRVTDAMTLPLGGLIPERELVRRIEGIAGEVPMRWRLEPRFGYASRPARIEPRAGVPVASSGADAIALRSWDAGGAVCDRAAISGEFVAAPGARASLALSASHGEPLVFPARDEVEARLDATTDYWRQWAGDRAYAGPWRDAVVRSALVLKLLVHAPSGAIAAAATTSLPEALGGERNWDYRYSWPRDSAFTLDALLSLGCTPEADAYFSWLLHASHRTHPRLQVLYRLDGGTHVPERELPLAGYRRSRPVRIGNAAAPQLQLDVYGELLQTAHRYADSGGHLDRETGRRLGEIADEVCELWRERDAGIWEVRAEPAHFTQSKLMCWVTLDCAAELAREGHVPTRNLDDWTRSAGDIREFVDALCWSPERAGPSASVVEQVTREWLVELLGLPADSSIGFVTGTQMAHVTGLAAARWHVLDAVGWDVGARRPHGAPPVRVLVGEKRHVTVDRALRLLGLGAPTVVAADDAGPARADALREALGDAARRSSARRRAR